MAGLGPLGAILGYFLSDEDRRRAEQMAQEGFGAYDDLQAPELERLQAEELGPSAMEGAREGPEGRAAQVAALDYLRRAMGGGPLAEDRAAAEAIMEPIDALTRGREEAAISRYRAAGRGGSTGELLARQQAAQAGAQAARTQGTALQSAAMQRALQAATASGTLGGAVRREDYDQAARRAAASDAIKEYNAAARERANRYNAGLGQQGFANQMALRGARSGARQRGSDFYRERADRAVATGAAIGGGADDALADTFQAAGSIAGAAAGNPSALGGQKKPRGGYY